MKTIIFLLRNLVYSALLIGIFPSVISAQQSLFVDRATLGIGSSISPIHSKNVGIGTQTANAKLDIYNYAYTTNKGFKLKHFAPNYTQRNQFGMDIEATSNNSGYLYGANIKALATGTSFPVVYGLYVDAKTTRQGYITGAFIKGSNANYGQGLYTSFSTQSGGYFSYGLYASAYAASSSTVKYAGYFNGNIKVNSAIYTSDAKLKQNIKPISSALEKVLNLEVKTYTFKTKEYSHMNLPSGKRTGFLAQQVEEVIPELVEKAIHPAPDSSLIADGTVKAAEDIEYKGIDYAGIVPFLTKAMQEQQAIIESLKAELNELKEELAGNFERREDIRDDKPGSLMQNYPNPASNYTTISYELEELNKSAKIKITEVGTGRIVVSQELPSNKIADKIRLETQSWASGTYVYSLWINGKMIDAKKMVIVGNTNY